MVRALRYALAAAALAAGGCGAASRGGPGIRGRGPDRPTALDERGPVRSVVVGPIDAQAVRRVIEGHADEVRACYERRLAAVPSLSGVLAVRWTVGTDGTASGARVVSGEATTLLDEEVAGCVVARVAAWEFPKASGERGGTAVVTYRWKFRNAAVQAAPDAGP